MLEKGPQPQIYVLRCYQRLPLMFILSIAGRPGRITSLQFCFIPLLMVVSLSTCSWRLNPTSLGTTVVAVPGGEGGIEFGDMQYDASLGKVLVPAGGAATLDLIDPDTLEIKGIAVSSTGRQDLPGAHGEGTTSVTAAHGFLYATDRTTLQVHVIDPRLATIVGAAAVTSTPDYVRYVARTNELWVTEKSLEQIEVFKLTSGETPVPVRDGLISVPNGPESLLIDEASGHAYTNQPKVGVTAVIDVATRSIVAQWGNGCSAARGMAMDKERGYLFIACNEGKLVMLDARKDGRHIASENFGGGIDAVGYNPRLAHVYLPSGKSGLLAIFAVTPTPSTPTPGAPISAPEPTPSPTVTDRLVRLGTADTAAHARCVTDDDRGNIWVCDPDNGRVFLIKDTFPPDKP